MYVAPEPQLDPCVESLHYLVMIYIIRNDFSGTNSKLLHESWVKWDNMNSYIFTFVNFNDVEYLHIWCLVDNCTI